MSNGDYHVTSDPDGRWQVLREGAERASFRHDTQGEEALTAIPEREGVSCLHPTG